MSHSSTSSSDPHTPDETDRPAAPTSWLPKAALGAVLLVLVINVIAGQLIAQTGWLPSEPRALVTKQVDELRGSEGVWLLGSSTLAQGIEPELLEKEAGTDLAVLTLGSAGPVSLTEMALAGLEGNARPPKAIYLFVFKDALNGNRPTIENDERYVASLNEPSFAERVTSVAPVYNYRHSIKFNARVVVRDTFLPARRVDAVAKDIEEKPIDNADLTALMDSGADFEVNLGRLSELSKVCRERSVKLYVVFTPATDAVVNWQAKYKPQLPYDRLLDQLREQGEAEGFELIDYTRQFPSTTLYFRDPYHIRVDYMAELTRVFAQRVRADLSNSNRAR